MDYMPTRELLLRQIIHSILSNSTGLSVYLFCEFQNIMNEVDRKKPFSSLEKDLFLNIIQKYDTILTCKQTNATSALKKKQSWENIAREFNESCIVTQKASTKQLIKLWYNMKAKARESKTKENIRHLTGGGPSVMDMDPIDSKVMDIDKNILTNIAVDIDSDIDGSVVILGDTNNKAWCRTAEATMQVTQEEKEIEFKTPSKKSYENLRINKIDLLKCKILEEELEFKKKMHEKELKIKVLERVHKENLFKIEIKIKQKELEKYDKESI
ncbi:hypothetical protein B5X24_HaOG208817 [Helicoverpa armigera]|uniref:Regulatory protein zeste n=1 Tax=Helicoverpa armigera TaxID=29058 RepID=A0A2W1BG46_HELAM|nr:hypothetical protein B5X24_HaOG208817 [Helicoverpa armigera]